VLVNPTNTSFLGFVSDRAITSLEVSVSGATASGPNVWPTVNNLTLGVAAVSAVPEPETSALMLAGLALLGAASRRRAFRR
jgi:PEP-CTERM motif